MAEHARTTRWVDRTLSTLAPLPLPLLHALGATLGTLLAYLPNEAQRVARLNLALCFPHLRRRERRRLLRHSLAETGKAALELAPVLKRSPKRLERWIRGVHGASHLQEAIARRQGVVLLAPHLGCWELLNLWLAARYPLTALYRPPRQAALEPILIAARTRNGGRLAPADRRGVRSVLHALARREMAGILPDQEPEGPAPFAPFFGFPAKTMTLAGRVAERSGATPVLAFAERLPRGRGFVLHFLPADPELAATDPQTATAALNRSIEACVQRAPPQYQWTYKRFSTRPDGARLYPRRRRRHRNLQKAQPSR